MKGLTQMILAGDAIKGTLEGGETFEIPIPQLPYLWVRKKEEKVASFWIKKYGIEGSVLRDEIRKTLEGEEVVKVEVADKSSCYVLESVLECWESDLDYLLQMRLDLDWKTARDYRTCFFDCEWVKKENDYEIKVIATDKKVYSGKEMDILVEFFRDLQNYDLAVGYGIEEYDIPILEKVCKRYGDSRLPKIHYFDYEIALENWGQRQLPSYKLGYVSQYFLNRVRKYEGSVSGLSESQLIERAMDDVDILKSLEEKLGLLKVHVAIASLSYLFPEDTYYVNRALESLVLKKAHELGYVLPNRRKEKTREKHSGAYVMKPKEAWKVYENVAYIDLRSLYPNIVIKFRISPDPEKRLLPELEEELLRRRAEVRGKDWALSEAYKLVGNALYGYLSYAHSRIYYPVLGDQIATEGRNVIGKLIGYLTEKGMTVVAGDTDSAFVLIGDKGNLDLKELSEKLGFEVDMKNYFTKLFFLGKGRGEKNKEEVAKKRYIGRDESGRLVIVGAEKVRSDVPPLVQEFQETIANMFLDGKSKEEIREFAEKFRATLLVQPVEGFVIRKGLRKKPEDYKSVPAHARAYLDAKSKGIEDEMEGDKIPFVWVKVGVKTKSVVPEYFVSGKSYLIATDYYWERYFAPTLYRTLGIRLGEENEGD